MHAPLLKSALFLCSDDDCDVFGLWRQSAESSEYRNSGMHTRIVCALAIILMWYDESFFISSDMKVVYVC